MTTLVKITLAFLVALFLSSCGFDILLGEGQKGNGVVAEENRSIMEEFTAVSASEGLDVYVHQGSTFAIIVEADENIIDLIATDIRDGKLRVHALKNIGRATKKIHVTLPEIRSLESSSGADLIAQQLLQTDEIRLSASSGSSLIVVLKANEAKADASSGADIRLSGEAHSIIAHASSGAAIKAGEFYTKIGNAKASSGADISVNVSEALVAEASSGGDVSYTGDALVQQKNAISGKISKY
ncbi:head GIN domain-containing protein [Arenibacter sp. GZD96]|uniref:head GIN domain-containing protein n=1 Tax=Aurantibrevibacter litoralis TaxID=3106030 RepID=UPI002AFE36AF|nr:head GIN domain-containing protein [Arenibacter sp. GZD-96]MEA1786026.1 head GIN domain-containing protein [Arenibacter sp. GZD-96]